MREKHGTASCAVAVSAGRGGGSCALGVDRRRSVESTGHGEGGFGQVVVTRGSAGSPTGERSYGEARRGDARGRTR